MDLTLDHTREQLDTLRTPQARPAAEQLLDPEAGTVTIGRTAAGTPAAVPLWTEHGAVHLGIVGASGAGASVILAHLWAAESVSPLVRSWAAGLDQDLDQDLDDYPGPALDRRACTPDQTRDLLADAARIARMRFAALSNWPEPYEPTKTEPLVTVTLTMWELVRLDPGSMRHVEELAAHGRKGGVSLRFAYRGHYLETLGGRLHATLSANTLIALRGGEIGRLLGRTHAAVPADMPGTGYLVSPRTGPALFRSWAPHRAAV
ncbi:hypothetical protein ACFVUY_38025 [Kitasatospora sp. NPDC058063]|uniref:hypothetical protein n=1 Tax=unclassified Kitasatospora TaxID=2633591 RepID=UPI0036DA3A57